MTGIEWIVGYLVAAWLLLTVAAPARRWVRRHVAGVLPFWALRLWVRITPKRLQHVPMLTPDEEIKFGHLETIFGNKSATRSARAAEAEAKAGRAAR